MTPQKARCSLRSSIVSAIYDSNNTIAGNVTVGNQPYGVAYDSAKGEVFVSNVGDKSVSIISDGTVSTSTSSTVPEFPPAAIAFIAVRLMAFVGLSSRKLWVRRG